MSVYLPEKMQHQWQENADGTVTIKSVQNVGQIMRDIAEERAEDERKGLQLTSGAGQHKIASIPMVVVQMWKDEGYDLMSPERSGMTKEEHRLELARRLNGDWAKLNTSRFKRV